MKEDFNSHRIDRQLNVAYSQHLNTVAQVMICTVSNLKWSIIRHIKLTKTLGSEVLQTARYLLNRVTCRTVPVDKTPTF